VRNLIAVVLLLGCGLAQAAVVTWTVDAVFDDGGILEGTFDFDDVLVQYSNINLVSSGGTLGPVFNSSYSSYVLPFSDSDTFVADTSVTNAVPQSILNINFSESLTAGGGIVSFVIGSGPTGSEEISGSIATGTFRQVTSGTVSTVPIPAAVWLFGSALAGLGWINKRRVA
jgi:hypothetical protein